MGFIDFDKKFSLRKGKLSLEKREEEKKEKPKTKIVERIIYREIPIISGDSVRVPIKKKFEYAYCGKCGAKFNEKNQKICEKCGNELW